MIIYYKKSLKKNHKTEITKTLFKIDKTADEITTDDIRYYLAIRQKKDGVTKTTANNELKCLSSFYGFLIAEELVDKNPCIKIEQIKSKTMQRKAFTEMEVEKIRNSCRTDRERAMIEIFLSTGCRVTELAKMMIADLDGEKIIVHGKGDKDRIVYLNAKAIINLQKYLSTRKDSNPYIFCGGTYVVSQKGTTRKDLQEWYKNPERVDPENRQEASAIENVIRKIGKRAEVAGTYPHRFRRTCATFALRRGMPIEQVSKMLGHEQISTTQVYLDLSEEELKQAHKKYVV
ncbi:MAG: tyrosine-type recombinase/integrase [Flavobacterium sp.]